MEKKLNPFELFVLWITFTVMCWAANSIAWFKKMDTALGAPLYRGWQRLDHFVQLPAVIRASDVLLCTMLTVIFLSCVALASMSFFPEVEAWFLENAFSKSWWPDLTIWIGR